jgi:hypothetical protein
MLAFRKSDSHESGRPEKPGLSFIELSFTEESWSDPCVLSVPTNMQIIERSDNFRHSSSLLDDGSWQVSGGYVS